MNARPNLRRVLLSVIVLVGFVVGGDALVSQWKSLTSNNRTFYVSVRGDDRADGRSVSRPWRTLSRVGAQKLKPGDRVLLAGGERFAGSLRVSPDEDGDAVEPVEIASYGSGRAIIEASDVSGVVVRNMAGVIVRDLVVVAGSASMSVDGISFYNDLPDWRRLAGVTVEGVDVSGFQHGIAIGAGPTSLGFKDVEVRDSALHDNRLSGLLVYGPEFDPSAPVYANENVTVAGVEAYRNTGDPTAAVNSGSGIVLGSVTVGHVDRCTAQGNGALSSAPEGPIGIWAYDSAGVVIENSLSFGNRTSGADGGGFGLDRNVSDSTLQYNLSYGNDGSGFLLFADEQNRTHTRNTVRFNISSNDSRRGDFHGGITVLGGLTGPNRPGGIVGAQIFQNTVMMGADGLHPPAVRIGGTVQGVVLQNNLLISLGGDPLVFALDIVEGAVRLQGNNYFSFDENFEIVWNGTGFTSLHDWRAATGQEIAFGRTTGSDADPELALPFPPTVVVTQADRIRDMLGFRLRAGSPMIGAGIVSAGDAPGMRDFFGIAVTPQVADIGASHFAGLR